jgi:hypothetical protein
MSLVSSVPTFHSWGDQLECSQISWQLAGHILHFLAWQPSPYGREYCLRNRFSLGFRDIEVRGDTPQELRAIKYLAFLASVHDTHLHEGAQRRG